MRHGRRSTPAESGGDMGEHRLHRVRVVVDAQLCGKHGPRIGLGEPSAIDRPDEVPRRAAGPCRRRSHRRRARNPKSCHPSMTWSGDSLETPMWMRPPERRSAAATSSTKPGGFVWRVRIAHIHHPGADIDTARPAGYGGQQWHGRARRAGAQPSLMYCGSPATSPITTMAGGLTSWVARVSVSVPRVQR